MTSTLLYDMKKWLSRFKKDESGGSAHIIGMGVAILLLCMVFFIWEFFRMNTIYHTVKDAAQDAVMANVTNNYDEVFSGFKNSIGTAVDYNETSEKFEFIFDEGEIYRHLDDTLGLIVHGADHIKENIYKINGLQASIISAPVDVSTEDRFNILIEIELIVPWSTIFYSFPPQKIKINESSNFTPKF